MLRRCDGVLMKGVRSERVKVRLSNLAMRRPRSWVLF